MENSERLIYIQDFNSDELNELWNNCFEGFKNLEHINKYAPVSVNDKNQLFQFLKNKNFTLFLIKRNTEQDIIGYIIFGEFIPGMRDNIGFVIGLNFINNGYATESLKFMIEHLKCKNLKEIFGQCFETNTPSIKVMENCGFQKIKIEDYHTQYKILTFKLNL